MLDASKKELILQHIIDNFGTLDTGAELNTLMDTYWTNTLRVEILNDIYEMLKGTKVLHGSKVVSASIDTPGTGYVAGAKIPVTGDGSGALVKITTVGGSGEITGVDVETGGYNYTTASTDLTALGDGLGVVSLTVDVGATIIDDAIAAL